MSSTRTTPAPAYGWPASIASRVSRLRWKYSTAVPNVNGDCRPHRPSGCDTVRQGGCDLFRRLVVSGPAGGGRLRLCVADPFGLGDQVVGGCRVREDPDRAGPTLLHRPGITDRLQGPGDQLDRRIERCDVAGAGLDEDPLVAVLGLRVREHPHPRCRFLGVIGSLRRVRRQDRRSDNGLQPPPRQPPGQVRDPRIHRRRGLLGSGRASWTIRRANHTSTHPSWTRRHNSGNRCRRSSPSPIRLFAAPSVVARTAPSSAGANSATSGVPSPPSRTRRSRPLPTAPGRVSTACRSAHRIASHSCLACTRRSGLLRTGGLRQNPVRVQPVETLRLKLLLELTQRLHRGGIESRVRQHTVPLTLDAVRRVIRTQPGLQLLRSAVVRLERRRPIERRHVLGGRLR